MSLSYEGPRTDEGLNFGPTILSHNRGSGTRGSSNDYDAKAEDILLDRSRF